MSRFASLLAILLTATAARAESDSAFVSYQLENETACVGAHDARLEKPVVYELNGFAYELNGAVAKVTRKSARKQPQQRNIGVLNAIKDDTEETRANLDEYLARFKEADVDAIFVGGDTAYDEFELESVLERVATLGVPVYAIIGNTESRGSFNRACMSVHRKKPNLINVDLVRVVDTDGVDFVSLPGYYDQRFTHATGSCVYKRDDLKSFPSLVEGLDGPVVALSHGPPKQSGKNAIDFVPEAGNAGDPAFTKAIEKAGIKFGIFGHILEAGGKASDPSGATEIKVGTWAEAMYLNPGSANSLPWRMNNGPTSYGMAALLTFEGAKARYEIIKSPRRIAVGN